jgi:hypothetical protein
MLVTAGICYGFEIRSELPFSYLRGGSGTPLDIVVAPDRGSTETEYDHLLDWNGPVAASVYARDDRYRIWIDGSGWFEVDTVAARVGVPESNDPVRREERLWGMPALLAFAARGDVPLHAAAVEVDGGAVLLAAPGTFGKTTLAAAFVGAGYRLLAEDLTCLRATADAAVVPRPAMLRLRRDVADALRPADAIVVGEDTERLHLAISPDARGDCAPVPLQAIVLLDPSEQDAALHPADGAAAIRDLLALSFRLPTAVALERSFAELARIVRDTRVWRLSLPHRLDQLERTVERIVADA